MINYITVLNKMQEDLIKLSSMKTKKYRSGTLPPRAKRLRRLALRAVLQHCRNARGAIGTTRVCERVSTRSGLIICAPLALQAAAQKGISPF